MKKILLFSLALIFVLSGCGEKSEQENYQSNITAEEERIMEKAEKQGYEYLTPEEQKVVEKFGQEAQKEFARAEEEEMRKLEEDVNLASEIDDLRDEKETGAVSRGSCDVITEGSTCIEYVGSFWTDQQMELNCQGAGVFSKSPCPAGMAGGCNIGEGVPSDMITWFYLYGGGEITAESLDSAKKVCEATMMSRWLNAR